MVNKEQFTISSLLPNCVLEKVIFFLHIYNSFKNTLTVKSSGNAFEKLLHYCDIIKKMSYVTKLPTISTK